MRPSPPPRLLTAVAHPTPPPRRANRAAAGARWAKFAGLPGRTCKLLSEGDGTQVKGTLEAGGLGGKAATYMRGLTLSRPGGAHVALHLTKSGAGAGKWLLAVTANGKQLKATQTVTLPGGVVVQASR